jgi:hypothetical protein
MANTIDKNVRLTAGSYVTFTSRYRSSNIFFYGNDRKITFSTYKKRSQVTSETDSFLTITKAFEFRPDLVSYKVYSTPDYWWKILEFNGMMDIFDFKNGRNIRLPSNFV